MSATMTTDQRIEVRSWMTPEAAAAKYDGTPGWDGDMIRAELAADPELRERMAGRSWHVGGGLWLMVCGHCDAYTLTHGSQPAYANIGPHMVAEHGARVAGINLGILS